MADPTSVLGAISASLHLAETILQYCSRFKDAPTHAQDLMSEVMVVGHVLGSLRAHLEREHEAGSNAFARTSVLFFAANGCRKQLEDLVDILKPLLSKNTLLRFWSRVKWPMEEDDAVRAVGALHRYAQIFHFAVNLDGISALNLSQHDALARIQSRLDALQEMQAIQGNGDALTAILDAVKELPMFSLELSKITKGIDRLVLDRELSRMLEYIPALPFRDRHRDLQLRRMEGVGQWILDMPQFIEWRDGSSGQGSTLWCNGSPGAGKTYLASVIVDHLEQISPQNDNRVLCFYLDYKQQTEQTPFKILQTLLRQLLSTYPRVPAAAMDLQTRLTSGKGLPSWNELKSLFIDLCNASGRVFIVIDALDECDVDSNRRPVLDLLRSLIGSRVRLLITSRPYPEDIENLLGRYPQVLVEASDADIRVYVLEQIAGSRRMASIIDRTLREEIISSIVAKSQGMFLLPALQIHNILGQTNKRQVVAALKSLPNGLAENLNLTIERIKSQNSQSDTKARLALNILMWLSTVRTPLTASELQHAIATSPEMLQLDDLIDPAFFVECCFGLVSIVKETSIVRLVHFSVNEYLQSKKNELFPGADATVAISSLSYLRLQSSLDLPITNPAEVEAVSHEWPFMIYSSDHWGFHAAACFDDSVSSVIRNFCSSRSTVKFWALLLEKRLTVANTYNEEDWQITAKYVKEGLSPLHLAALYGINKLAEECVRDQSFDIYQEDSSGVRPLMIAAARGHLDIVDFLLSRSSNETVNLADHEGRTALGYAMKEKQVEAVKRLLHSCHDVDINKGAPFLDACSNRYAYFPNRPEAVKIVQLFLARPDSDPNPKSTNPEKSPLFQIACSGNSDLFLSLLKHPRFNPWFWNSPAKGLQVWARYVLNCDYDVGVWGSDDLMVNMFTMIPHLERDERMPMSDFQALQLLWPVVYYANTDDSANAPGTEIDWLTIWDDSWRPALRRSFATSGISLDTVDSKGRGFVHYLANKGLDDFLRFVLDHDSAVNRPDSNGRTALHYAVSGGHEGAVRILLDAGADHSVVDKRGHTAFLRACLAGSLSVVEILLDRGASITAIGKWGETALHLAARANSSEPLIDFLLGSGLPLDAVDMFGTTPLSDAIAYAAQDACKVLLERGANVNVTTCSRGPLLAEAVARMDAGITRLLATHATPDKLNQLSSLGMSVVDFFGLYPSSIIMDLGICDPSQIAKYSKNPQAVRRSHTIMCLLEKIDLMLSGDDEIKKLLGFRVGVRLMLLDDDAAARVMFECDLDPRSKQEHCEPFFAENCCENCFEDEGTLYKCRTCIFVSLCAKCRDDRKPGQGRVPYCHGHEYLAFPSEEWRHLPKGIVNSQGQTLDEFLLSLKVKYAADPESV